MIGNLGCGGHVELLHLAAGRTRSARIGTRAHAGVRACGCGSIRRSARAGLSSGAWGCAGTRGRCVVRRRTGELNFVAHQHAHRIQVARQLVVVSAVVGQHIAARDRRSGEAAG